MHVLSQNDAFLVYALLGKFFPQKCSSRENVDLSQVCSQEVKSFYYKMIFFLDLNMLLTDYVLGLEFKHSKLIPKETANNGD